MSQIEHPIGRMLSLAGKSYLQLLRSKLRHLDIDRYYYALVVIDSMAGNITQQELAQLLDSDKVSIVRIVNYLSEKGYVNRLQKDQDHRKYNLVITEKAKLAIPEIKDTFSELNNQVLKGVTDSKSLEFIDILKKIRHNITENTQSL